MTDRMECPDCGLRMEQGFIPDFGHGSIRQLLWHAGTPEAQKFLGMTVGGEAVRFDRSEAVQVFVLRCSECGLLKLYAPPETEVER